MNNANERDDKVAKLNGRENHVLMHSLAHEIFTHSILCELAKSDYRQLKQEPKSEDVYERLGAGNCSANVWKLYRGDDIWRYRFGLLRTYGGQDQFLFKPHDVLNLPKLVQNLAAFFADDGCLPLLLRNELKQLAADLDQFLAEREGCTANGEDPFGECPICRSNDGYLNIRKQHWFLCHTHHMKWCVGEDLLGRWKSESEDDWQKNAERIKGYAEVEPVNLSYSQMHN